MVNVWLCAIDSNEGNSSYREFKDRMVVAQGWPETGDLSPLVGKNWDEIHAYLVEQLGDAEANEPRCRNAFKYLISAEGIKAGDLVVAYEGTSVMGICQIKSNTQYKYDGDKEENYNYANTLYPVEWIDWSELSSDFQPNAPAKGVQGITRSQTYSNQIADLWVKKKA